MLVVREFTFIHAWYRIFTEITEDSFELSVLERGTIYFHSFHKDGHKICMFFRNDEVRCSCENYSKPKTHSNLQC